MHTKSHGNTSVNTKRIDVLNIERVPLNQKIGKILQIVDKLLFNLLINIIHIKNIYF